jgi:tetratricopeptide (TPR) repeat protein
VPQWLSRAAAAAEDLITKENAGEDLRLRVAVRALAACVGMRGELDPTPWAKQVLEQGETRLQATPDAIRQAQLQWDLGMALYDALQAYQIRGEHENALKYGEQAIAYLEKVDPQRRTAASDYLLGRLYFRIGAVHALRGQKHKEAVVWFDKAAPLLDRPLPVDARGEIGHHGETFVSMGVSFWESGEQDKAIDLTAKGITLMEEAVKLGLMERSALAIPYTNLAAMHGDRGQKEEAGRYQRMATQSKQSKLK